MLKKTIIATLIFTVLFFNYAAYLNRHTMNMSFRQKILKTVYPALMWFSGKGGKNTQLGNEHQVTPATSIYDLTVELNDGTRLPLSTLKGKKILIVNTASDCGYTNQYEALQQLWQQHKNKLAVIGFPANDFKEQEKGRDEEIAIFCKRNYGVDFPLAKKSTVIKSPEQNPVFRWLTHKEQNGWSDNPPSWNFSKYLLDEEGRLVNYFEAGVSPLDETVLNAINK